MSATGLLALSQNNKKKIGQQSKLAICPFMPYAESQIASVPRRVAKDLTVRYGCGEPRSYF